MKRLIPTLFCIILLSNLSKGQFPYASIWSDFTPTYTLTSGFPTTASTGFLWCGYQPAVQPGGFPWWPNNMNFFIRGVGASAIWPAYKVFQGSGANCSGALTQVLNGSGVTAIEAINGSTSTYAVAGAFDRGCYFTKLNSSGVPIATAYYPFPPSLNSAAAPVITRPLIVYEPLSGDFFIVGGLNGEIYVLRVGASGSIVWSSFYKLPANAKLTPKDFIYSGNPGDRLLIVGEAEENSSNNNGFLLDIPAGQGNGGIFRMYGDLNADESLSSIVPSSASAPGNGPGFVIAGSTKSMVAEGWILKVDIAGNVLWSNIVQPATGANLGFVDVIERTNTFGAIEYYGLLRSPSGMVVLKLDNFGNPFPLSTSVLSNEFIYNMPAVVPAVPVCLSQVAGPSSVPDVGIQVYGTANNLPSASTSYFVSAYFNGETNCMALYNQQNAVLSGSTRMINHSIITFGSLSTCSSFQIQVIYPGGAMNFPCSGFMLSGSNARPELVTGLSQEVNADAAFAVFPNPVTDKATLRFSVEQDQEIQVEIQNLLGQTLKRMAYKSDVSGIVSEEIDMDILGVPGGVYLVSAAVNGKSQTQKIFYTK